MVTPVTDPIALIVSSTSAPLPCESVILTLGATAYPRPGLSIRTSVILPLTIIGFNVACSFLVVLTNSSSA